VREGIERGEDARVEREFYVFLLKITSRRRRRARDAHSLYAPVRVWKLGQQTSGSITL